ncbi:carbonate dehydratase [Marinimicrobium sp. ABcell2]|uniref:carbonate dehydratase n=1 Tax=Marinimicrobium sp. ABcell2 TaxID=3069751 RepID=UPI0027B41CD3|nr:carbonate dehydratase [Marinimicrobium sp. ABcell2]MDQ2078449.1 carbonate dehydratase [Marinimicrobium sp. ABcell2]
MPDLESLFTNNVQWAEQTKEKDPEFFNKLAAQQTPEFLWIGCADSRVPANEIVGLLPGELFVHRNVANLVIQTDLNCLSVMQFAVEYLKVKHIIVTGHYGCGGVKAAMEHKQLGMLDYWVRNIRDVYFHQQEALDAIEDDAQRIDRLCELNVIQQVANVSHTNIVQNAWKQGQELTIHGWIYSIKDGLLRKLVKPIKSIDQVDERYRMA